MGDSIGVFVNQQSARGGAVHAEVLAAFAAAGLAAHPIECERSETLGATLLRVGPAYRAIAIGGGDGTLHAALPALLALERPLGILPLGTANDYATSLGLPKDLEGAIATIKAGGLRRVDVASVDGRPYLNVASVGLAAEVTRHLTAERKRRFGSLSYPITAIERWRTSRPFSARVESTEGVRVLLARQIAIANGPSQGGRVANPAASLDSGTLVLTAIRAQSIARTLYELLAVRLGRAATLSDAVVLTSPHFRIETRRPRPITADGEPVGHTPAEFRSLPAALEVFAPSPPPREA